MKRRDESGFTILEIAITGAILMIVTTTLFQMLDSGTRTEQRVNAFADNQEVVRQAMVEVLSDVRAAEPLKSGTPVDMLLQHCDLSDVPTVIQWRYDPGQAELTRSTLGGISYRLTGVSEAKFEYLDKNGTATAATDALQVRVTIAAAPEMGPAPHKLESVVHLRNKLSGAPTC